MDNKVVLIIQARMGSKRLPGKSMLDLAGKPLIERILDRVKKCNLYLSERRKVIRGTKN